jgi:hypothetical protein
MGRRHQRQLLLFLAILILPIVTIAVQGRRLLVQEEALARTRVEEIRTRTAAEIGQEIVARLERIKTREMANVPAAASYGDGDSDPAVVAVGWAEGAHLVWPWDGQPVPPHGAGGDSRYSQAIEAGRRAEFEARNDAIAADRYQQAVERARDDSERAPALLAVARTRLRTGGHADALAAYRDVLDLPSAVTDEHGVSYWSSAALPLVELGAGAEVLARVHTDLSSTDRPLPLQLYRVRSILEALRQSGDEAVAEQARAALAALAPRLADVERLERLQGAFPRLPVSSTAWQPYESTDPWLIGRSPEGATARPLVLVVRWSRSRSRSASCRRACGRCCAASRPPAGAPTSCDSTTSS